MNEQLILGTAGHIDHGKTALVKALTGVMAGIEKRSAGGEKSGGGPSAVTDIREQAEVLAKEYERAIVGGGLPAGGNRGDGEETVNNLA